MKFIPAKEEHYPSIVTLVSTPEELFLVHPSGTFPWDILQLQTLAESRSKLTVCLVKGEVVAYANLYNVEPGVSAFIGNVIVAEHHRGKGVGKLMMQHMMEVCQSAYEATPKLSVFAYNTKALLLYSEIGFAPYSIEPRVNLKGERVPLIHMSYGGG